MPEHLLFADSLLDNSLRNHHGRGFSALASFAVQALAIAALLIVPLLYTQRIPPLHLTGRELIAPAPLPQEPIVATPREGPSTTPTIALRPLIVRNFHPSQMPPPDIEQQAPPPDLPPGIGSSPEKGSPIPGVFSGPGTGAAPYIPPKPTVTAPPRVSRMMEGNLIQRFEPPYPPLAKQARIQGQVVLRALISRTGAIENVQVVSGHPMLAPAAVNAVRQWRYRPYVLNGEPVEVETQVTVNFLLTGQ